jgi:hypothetical protein
MDLASGIEFRNLIVFLVLVLPGFISMRVYSLIRPGEQPTLKDTIFEAIAYSTINFGLLFWPIMVLIESENIYLQGLLCAIIFVIAPAIWPFVLDRVLEATAGRGWIQYRYKTAWDDFFSRRKACWLIVHLHDGRRLGGIFHNKSYATLYPTPGHLFIEELWEVDQESGEFVGSGPLSQGIILKPEDYRFVEIKAYIGD